VARGRTCITSLKPEQAWALYELGVTGGLVGHIPVGCGKTGLDFLAPLAVGAKKALLLYPASLIDPQIMNEYATWSRHWRLPSLVIHGHDYTPARGEIGCTLHVMSYSRLSRPDSTDFLDREQYDLIICDEVHKLRNSESARYRRLARNFAARPETRFAGWSGSLTDAGLADYWHFCAFALRDRSPLPLKRAVVDEWAAAVDPSDDPAPPGALAEEFCAEGESVQSGYRRRLTETQGIVVVDKPSSDAAVEVCERPVRGVPTVVEDALRELRGRWVRPDGDDVVDQLSLARTARELACGFYYYWYFPHGEPRELVEEWLAARKLWRSELRAEIQRGREYMDSEYLATRAAMRAWGDEAEPSIEELVRATPATETECHEGEDGSVSMVTLSLSDAERLDRARVKLERWRALPRWKAMNWPRWRDVRDNVRPETRTQRLDDFLARDAAAWAVERRGIVWYSSVAFGAWIAEIAGAEIPLHGGGPTAGDEIDKWCSRFRVPGAAAAPSIVASIKSHGTGRDQLQYLYADMLFAEPPATPTAWEQAIGRLHRTGLTAPVVRADYYAHTKELIDAVERARLRAEYVVETVGASQKILSRLRE
jgi:hypothetical protein